MDLWRIETVFTRVWKVIWRISYDWKTDTKTLHCWRYGLTPVVGVEMDGGALG